MGTAESSASVYGCCGLLNNSSAVAISTILPKYITAMRSLMCLTTDRSWAMNRYVSPNSFCSSSSRLSTCAWIETSRAETGSSQMISLGLTARARAMPIRCRCPPENSCGYRFVWCGERPTTSSSSCTRRTFSLPRARLWISNGSPTMSPTVMRGFNEEYGSWKMICMSRRSLRSSSLVILKRLRPSKKTSPLVGSISRKITRPVVVFPEPDSPTRPSVSPRRIANETPSTAFTAPIWRCTMNPLVMGKYFTNLRTSKRMSLAGPALTLSSVMCLRRSVSSSRAVGRGRQPRRHGGAFLVLGRVLAVQETPRRVVGANRILRRVRFHADLHGKRTPGRKRAPGGQVNQTGRLPFNGDEAFLTPIELGDGVQQPPGVRVLGIRKGRIHGRPLHRPPRVHHHDVVARLRHHRSEEHTSELQSPLNL